MMPDVLYLWFGLAVLVAIVIGIFDTLRRKRVSEAEARMTPEQLEISRREAKAMQGVWWGGWGQG